MTAPVISHVHETHVSVSNVELTPPHPPRTETPVYRATHKRLVITEDRPCYVCGVRRSDLRDPVRRKDKTINPYGAKSNESHHWPVERSLADSIDPQLVAAAFPSVKQFKTFIEWVDSEFNMLVLCDKCHRLAPHAIHHAVWQDVIATKFALRDTTGDVYQFAATAQDAAQAEALDERIMQADGLEPAAAASLTPSSDGAASVSALAGERSSPTASNAQSVTAPAPASVSGAGVSVRAGVAPGRPSAKTRAPRTPRKRAQA